MRNLYPEGILIQLGKSLLIISISNFLASIESSIGIDEISPFLYG